MIVGITGGIGCGKSVVSKIIDLMGYPIYDSDTVLVGTYCSHFDEDNPDCEHCKSFYPV